MSTSTLPFVVSAPGKVIIFGEHAAVYGKPAIAAAVSLRTYLLVSDNEQNDDEIVLNFPDIDFYHTWKRDELPWDILEKFKSKARPQPSDELIPEVVDEISKNLAGLDKTIHYSAAFSFLYLYLNLCSRHQKGLRFTARSTLPVGAGLGSSASISVCLTAAFALLGNHIKPAPLKDTDLSVDNADSLFIDSWAFLGEKCIHGNPSGIDNAVATHGGAVMFQRMTTSIPNVRTTMRNFPALKLLLTNTKHPRRTSELVANVGRLSNEYPKTTSNILDAIENLTREAYNLMIRPFFDAEARGKMRELVELNHGLLVSLGVSHPTLERVRMLTDELNIGKTKLTGAGGGGCAITLINDDVDEALIQELIKKYESLGFESYETKLGGKGVAYLHSDSCEKLTPDSFVALNDRHQVEHELGVDAGSAWRFW